MNEFFKNIKSVHFVGVGGVSMAKLCAYTLSLGIKCTGSDQKNSSALQNLKNLGANVYVGSNQNVAKQADIVVYSSAIKQDDKELVCAKVKVERKDYLAEVAKNFKTTVAISGAHGKTTATALLFWVLKIANKSFYPHFGGKMIGEENFVLATDAEIFLTEACEYNQSFLKLSPDIGVVLNVDFDHPDCYKSFDETMLAFLAFASKCKNVVVNSEIKGFNKNLNAFNNNQITFAQSNADFCYENLVQKNNYINFDVKKQGVFFENITFYSPNKINVYSLLAVIAVADFLGISAKKIALAIATFPGLKNRFECLGVSSTGARIIVDYAHHPTQIKNSIKTAQEILGESKRLFVLFEPHTYSRTKSLFYEFCDVLQGEWNTIILPTFPAREQKSCGYDSIKLYQKLSKQSEKIVFANGYQEAMSWLKKNAKSNDIVLCLGAGLNSEMLAF